MIKFYFITNLRGWLIGRPSFLDFSLLLHSISFIICGTLLSSCDKGETASNQIYEGPLREGEHIEMLYSEKEKVTVKILAKRFSELQNGDRTFPEGVYIEFYDENGNISSTLSANTAYYYKAEQKWKGQGKVEVKNILKQEQLNTEELFWFPATKKINTDKFVNIRSGKEVIYGTGLDAKQDMSEYSILKPQGEFAIEEESQPVKSKE